MPHLGMKMTARIDSAWSLNNLPNKQLVLLAGPTWCFADAAKTIPCGSGDLVYTWADSSGNGRDFSRADAGSRPTLALAGGKWSVNFSATAKRIDGGNLSAAFPTAATLAFRYSQTGDGRCVMLTASGADGWDRVGGNSYPQYLRATRIDLQPNLGEGTHTQVLRSTTTAWNRRYDGVQDIATTDDFSAAAVNSWIVGTRQVGSVFGIVATSDSIDDATAALLETYLATLSP